MCCGVLRRAAAPPPTGPKIRCCGMLRHAAACFNRWCLTISQPGRQPTTVYRSPHKLPTSPTIQPLQPPTRPATAGGWACSPTRRLSTAPALRIAAPLPAWRLPPSAEASHAVVAMPLSVGVLSTTNDVGIAAAGGACFWLRTPPPTTAGEAGRGPEGRGQLEGDGGGPMGSKRRGVGPRGSVSDMPLASGRETGFQ